MVFWMAIVIVGTASLSIYYQSLFKAALHRVVFLPVWFAAAYANLFILMPRFWDRQRWLSFASINFVLILLLTVFQRWICIKFIYPDYFWMKAPTASELNVFWIEPFIQFYFYIGIPVMLIIALRQGFKWYRESYLARQQIAEQQAAELKYLKAQINPHFLFNTLNNLYGLSLESSKKVPDMILKLSDILSYSLYESSVNQIILEKEIDLINDFIALEKERYSNRISINMSTADNITYQEHIAPLLFMPLIENAFKHGVKESTETVEIDIALKKKEGYLSFSVVNDFAAIEESKTHSGIGLQNLRRRLDILYPDNYELETEAINTRYHALIKIPFDD